MLKGVKTIIFGRFLSASIIPGRSGFLLYYRNKTLSDTFWDTCVVKSALCTHIHWNDPSFGLLHKFSQILPLISALLHNEFNGRAQEKIILGRKCIQMTSVMRYSAFQIDLTTGSATMTLYRGCTTENYKKTPINKPRRAQRSRRVSLVKHFLHRFINQTYPVITFS